MRKTLTALLIAAALPVTALAMPDQAGDHRFGHDAPHHKAFHGKRAGGFHGMDLTPEQRQNIGRIMREQRQSHQQIHPRYLDKLPQKEREAMQKEFRDNREKRQQEIRAVLTPEQQKRFDEMRQKREARQAEWREFQDWTAGKEKAR